MGSEFPSQINSDQAKAFFELADQIAKNDLREQNDAATSKPKESADLAESDLGTEDEESVFPEPRVFLKNKEFFPAPREILGDKDLAFLSKMGDLIKQNGINELLNVTALDKSKLVRFNILIRGKSGNKTIFTINPEIFREEF